MSSGTNPSEPDRARPRTVAVTGADGFVGRALCPHLEAHGLTVRRLLRLRQEASPAGTFPVGDIGPDTDWSAALQGIDRVVHLAARVHVMRDTAMDPLAEFRHVNVEGTRCLARTAAAAGVQRFVFLSSIKVNGESTRQPFTEADAPRPEDPYGISKLEAEQALMEEARRTGMQCVILRPPLIYGPGVGGNFLSLMRAVARRVPLPLAAIDNLRSLVYLGNLVDAIRTCLEQDSAVGKTWLVSDGEDMSTAELVRRLGGALTRPIWLLPIPVSLLRLAGALTGKTAAVARLVDSLQVDATAIRVALRWTPPYSVDQGLLETARWFRGLQGARA